SSFRSCALIQHFDVAAHEHGKHSTVASEFADGLAVETYKTQAHQFFAQGWGPWFALVVKPPASTHAAISNKFGDRGNSIGLEPRLHSFVFRSHKLLPHRAARTSLVPFRAPVPIMVSQFQSGMDQSSPRRRMDQTLSEPAWLQGRRRTDMPMSRAGGIR